MTIALDRYMDGIARTALVIRDDVREVDPYGLLDQLTRACQQEPQRMAQVIMAMAAMMPPEETTRALNRRVWAVVANRCER